MYNSARQGENAKMERPLLVAVVSFDASMEYSILSLQLPLHKLPVHALNIYMDIYIILS